MAVRSGGGGGQDAQYQMITLFSSIGKQKFTKITKVTNFRGSKTFQPFRINFVNSKGP